MIEDAPAPRPRAVPRRRTSAEGAPRLSIVPGTPAVASIRAQPALGDASQASGLALWCTMAALAEQLAAANARRQATIEHQAAALRELERDNDRLVAEAEQLTAALVTLQVAYAGTRRRASLVVSGLAFVVAAMAGLLVVVGVLATAGGMR